MKKSTTATIFFLFSSKFFLFGGVDKNEKMCYNRKKDEKTEVRSMQHKQTGMSLKQYMLVLLLSCLLVLCLLCPAAQADDGMGEAVDLSALDSNRTLTDGAYHLTGSTVHSLTIGGTVTLWLDNASILTAGEEPALVVTDSADLTIRLVGENKLSASGEEQAGLSISTGAQVTIGTSEDTGSLAITGEWCFRYRHTDHCRRHGACGRR